MSNLFDSSDREVIRQRVAQLRATSTRQWGKMEVAQMLAHCAIAFEVPCGDRKMTQVFLGRLLSPLVRGRLLTGEAPMGRNAPTNPEYKVVDDRDFAREHQRLMALMSRFCDAGASACDGVVHPFFGRLSGEQWGTLMYKHMDHHLRQFGV